jgi:hypothetical protein
MDDLDEWIWCWHCKRVSLRREWKQPAPAGSVAYQKPDDRQCPYEGCGKSLYSKGRPYPLMREGNPEWPETPERGVIYDSPQFVEMVVCELY